MQLRNDVKNVERESGLPTIILSVGTRTGKDAVELNFSGIVNKSHHID